MKVPKKVPAKKMAKGGPVKGYVVGGSVSDLTPEQLSKYNALSSDADKAQFMDNLGGKTSTPGLGNAAVGGIGAAANLATSAITSNIPTNQKTVVGKDIANDAVKYGAEGAQLGTAIGGPVGTAIGAGVGLVGGAIMGGIRGNKEKKDMGAAQAASQEAAAQSKVGSAYKKGGSVSKHGDISAEKAAEILKDGTVYGKPITDKQRKFFGAKSQGLDMGGAVGGGGDAGGGGSGVSSGGGGISVQLGPPEHAKKPKGLLFALGGNVELGGDDRIKGTTKSIDMYSQDPKTGNVFKMGSNAKFSQVSDPSIWGSLNDVQKLPYKNITNPTINANYTETVMPFAKTPLVPGTTTPIPMNKAKGGQIKGPGGPKDDKIPMKAAEGSFVVPAANANKAKELRKQYLADGGSTKKVDVKVSNGEHIFTPQEVNVLRSKGVDLNALAPHADEKLEKKNGGGIHINPKNVGKFTATKKATGKTTEELSHSSNPLTKKRAIFAQNAAKWKHKEDGGIVAALKSGGKVIPTIQPIISSSQKQVANSPQQADAEQELGSKIVVPTTNKPVSNKKFANTQSPIGNAIKVETTTTGKVPPSADGSIAQTETGDKIGLTKYYKGGKIKEGDVAPNTSAAPDAGSDIAEEKNSDNPDIFAKKESAVTEPTVTGALKAQDKLNTLADNAKKDAPKSTHSNIDKLLAAGQVGLGLAQTLAYKRPQYTIPSEVQQAYGEAKQAATYGLDPAAKAQIENDIKAQTNTSTGLVAGVSGGNAANAYRMIQGLDQAAGKGLINMYVQDAAAKRAKQQQTYGLAAQLANYKNFAYQQDMNRFQQNQQAGANLLQSGISNLAGSFQYDKALEAQQQRDAMYGGKTINIPTT